MLTLQQIIDLGERWLPEVTRPSLFQILALLDGWFENGRLFVAHVEGSAGEIIPLLRPNMNTNLASLFTNQFQIRALDNGVEPDIAVGVQNFAELMAVQNIDPNNRGLLAEAARNRIQNTNPYDTPVFGEDIDVAAYGGVLDHALAFQRDLEMGVDPYTSLFI